VNDAFFESIRLARAKRASKNFFKSMPSFAAFFSNKVKLSWLYLKEEQASTCFPKKHIICLLLSTKA